MTLSEIPLTLFNDFSTSSLMLNSKEFRHTGARSIVKIQRSGTSCQNGHHTFVFEDYLCDYNRLHRKTLMVFNFPISMKAFAPGENLLYPKLMIRFSADDPPYSPRSTIGQRFEPGKGFWVAEHLTVKYGGNTDNNMSITSNYGDWEFAFFLHIQQRCHELARQVADRGHWQYEWNPKGDYREKPVLR